MQTRWSVFSFALLIVLIALLLPSSGRSQTPDWSDSTVKVPINIFPLGAVNFGFDEYHDSVMGNRIKEAGLNSLYENWGNASMYRTAKGQTKGARTYLPWSDTIDAITGMWRKPYHASERRFFLASNDTAIYAYEKNKQWNKKVRTLQNVNPSPSDTIEWLISRTDGISGDPDYVLKELQVHPTSLIELGWPNTDLYTVDETTDSAFCDFFYRLENADFLSTDSDVTIFDYEIYTKEKGQAAYTLYQTLPITFREYLNSIKALTAHGEEHIKMRYFPLQQLQDTTLPSTHKYGRLRIVIPILTSIDTTISIECRLKTHHLKDIYVRGLRVRSHLAQNLLTGKLDGYLDDMFQHIKDTLVARGAWKNTEDITAASEIQVQGFRALAYMDQRCFKKIGKHIVPFLTENVLVSKYPHYRVVYEDETNDIPPTIIAECFWIYSDSVQAPPYIMEAIGDSIKNLRGFTLFGYDSAFSNQTDYDRYTKRFQAKTRWCQKMTAAAAAFPPGKKQTKWWGMLSSIMGIETNNDVRQELDQHSATVTAIRDTLVARFRRGECPPSQFIVPWLDVINPINIHANYRPQFKPEIRTEAWDALAWGAKGILWNSIGSDKGGNIGITDEFGRHDYDFDSTQGLRGHVQFGSIADPFFPESLYTYHRIIDPLDGHDSLIDISVPQSALPTISHGRWVRATQTDDKGNIYWQAFFNTNCYIWNQHRWPYGISYGSIQGWIPTFYGYRERWEGVKRANEDIHPIAKTLSELTYKATVNYSQMFYQERDPVIYPDINGWKADRLMDSVMALMNMEQSPIKDFVSTQIKRYTVPLMDSTISDDSNKTYVELGFFEHPAEPIDSGVHYLIIANRRTWPLYWNSDGTIDNSGGRLGAIDARHYYFKLDKTKLNAAFPFYSVLNMRTGKEQQRHVDSMFDILLEPGEGTLLRIAPCHAFANDEVSDTGMAYNNGHRVVDMGSRRIMTYVRNGNLHWNLTNNGGKITEMDFLSQPGQPLKIGANYVPGRTTDSLLNPTHNAGDCIPAVNPSITGKQGAFGECDTVIILYNTSPRDFIGARNLYAVWGTYCVTVGHPFSITWHEAKQIASLPFDADATLKKKQLLAPSVTPAKDGFIGVYSVPENGALHHSIQPIELKFIDSTGGYKKLSVQNLSTITSPNSSIATLFPTIASRDEFSPSNSTKERFHIAWEEWADGEKKSNIYYKRIDLTTSGGVSTYNQTFIPELVNHGAVACEHHHPNIAVINKFSGGDRDFGEPFVTWERVERRNECNDALQTYEVKKASVMLRQRYPKGNNNWSQFDVFYPKDSSSPLPQVKSGWDKVEARTNSFSSQNYRNVTSVSFQDEVAERVHVERVGTNYTLSSVKNFGWDHWQNKENGRYPSIDIPYFGGSTPTTNLYSYTYRGIIPITTTETPLLEKLYTPRITARQFVIENKFKTGDTQILWAGSDCGGIGYGTGGGSTKNHSIVPPPPDDPPLPPMSPPYWQEHEYQQRNPVLFWHKDLTRFGTGFREWEDDDSLYSQFGFAPYGWPITEDSIRTEYITPDSNLGLHLNRTFIMPDTNWVYTNFPDTSYHVEFQTVLKDSLHLLPPILLDKIVVQGPLVLGAPPTVQFFPGVKIDIGKIAKQAKPSWCVPSILSSPNFRKNIIGPSVIPPVPNDPLYLTVIATKSQNLAVDLSQEQVTGVPIGSWEDDFIPPALKTGKEQPQAIQASSIKLYAHPNPFTQSASIDVSGVTGNTRIDVYNILGELVTTLYDGEVSSEETLHLTLDGSTLAKGSYLVRVVSSDQVITKQIQLVK